MPAHAAALRDALRGVVAVEWWAHTRDPASPHQLHFDVNEDVLRRGLDHYHLAHPRLSSVLFLPSLDASAAETTLAAGLGDLRKVASRAALESACPGGPTLVLDQTPRGYQFGRECPFLF
ncbi:hypothetical protein GPECTOR_14g173 [Gonium pectorale]|uniref:Uncharacterized protein n=1 Tax=Gonium pectorale TaxID=33097 RepID=A0A150GM99_GONPE|nr:hypothetical protein GPECTOR_14g173 [Gonium pectorale]|eukprot:KXZ50927.1 hypothetical protein GPECTOR_14g173 [Gonium pectorale]